MEYFEYEKRNGILKHLPHNAVVAELGVYSGGFSSKITRLTKPKKLYLVDPYWRNQGLYYSYGRSKMDVFQMLVGRMKKWDKENVATIVIDFGCDFLQDMPDKYFDWIYLDTTHMYQDTLNELEIMHKKIKDNGYLAGHDWRDNPKHIHRGIKKAINEWLLIHTECELVIRDRHGQWIIKKNGHTCN